MTSNFCLKKSGQFKLLTYSCLTKFVLVNKYTVFVITGYRGEYSRRPEHYQFASFQSDTGAIDYGSWPLSDRFRRILGSQDIVVARRRRLLLHNTNSNIENVTLCTLMCYIGAHVRDIEIVVQSIKKTTE